MHDAPNGRVAAVIPLYAKWAVICLQSICVWSWCAADSHTGVDKRPSLIKFQFSPVTFTVKMRTTEFSSSFMNLSSCNCKWEGWELVEFFIQTSCIIGTSGLQSSEMNLVFLTVGEERSSFESLELFLNVFLQCRMYCTSWPAKIEIQITYFHWFQTM